MKQKFYIDTHKGITALFVLTLMAIYHQWGNWTAWVYLALHGTYGFLWVLKSRIFPDKTWEQSCSLVYGLVIWAGLSMYWVAPWLLITRGVEAPAWYLGICISMYAFGVCLHFAADMQKYTSLKFNPEHLITDGFFSKVRNPNYMGELLIYAGFGLLAMHWLPIMVLLCWILLVWIPRMLTKDRRLSRYDEFENYKKRTWLFIPFIF